MDKFIIEGGHEISGKIEPSGSKNSALPILCACVLAETPSVIHNCPRLTDIETMRELLHYLGVKTEWIDNHSLKIDPRSITLFEAPYDIVRKMRASINILGPLIGRFKKARVSLPGGCSFGPRPVDLHIKGMEALGARVEIEHGYIVAEAKKLTGQEIYLSGSHGPSRGATSNVMMAGTLAEGETVIYDVAREPETIELVEFLRAMGADIEGEGTDIIKVRGVKSLKGAEFTVMTDYIEAGTYLVAGTMAGSNIEVIGNIADNLKPVLAKLKEAGCKLEITDDSVKVYANKRPSPIDVTTSPYPGFPTDMQAQFCAYLSLGSGTSIITEMIYPDRFMHAQELARMGADIKRDGAVAIIRGVEKLTGATVMASDLRASAALVLAGLVAEGETHIRRIYHIDRGYEKIEEKLSGVGAKIRRVEEE
ncbi:MAG: UDP-N-acetylglucosamine 1-carboxyvinyltransferase [bacterium]